MLSSNSPGPSPGKRVVKLPTMDQILRGDPQEAETKQASVEPAPVPEGVVALPGFDIMTRYNKKKSKEKHRSVNEDAADSAAEEAPEAQAAEGDAEKENDIPENDPSLEAPEEAPAAPPKPDMQAVMGEVKRERERILREAAAERQRILDEATLEAIQMRDQIRQEEEQRAKQESREQVQDIMAVLKRAIREFEKEKESMFELLEQKLLATTIAIAELVFRQEITCNTAAYAAIIKAALTELETDHASKLYTSPDAYDVIMHEPDCAPIVERLNEIGIEILRDPTVPPGDVLVRSAESTLQYGTATMVKRMTERIQEQMER